jgi:oxygen-independent coproporphyrinogen-3 oxidase
MSQAAIAQHARPVPRYTSYPTAPHFHEGIGNAAYRDWIATVPTDAGLSLYMHIPFCDRLCWFCGCQTKQVLRYDPIAAYLPSLARETRTVAGLLDGRGTVRALHLGGGSPSMLAPADLVRLAGLVGEAFTVDPGFEFSIEIDPNDMTADRYDAFAAACVTRISIGVQDFDPRVQAAINRPQSFDATRAVVEGMRARGLGSVNLDVLYGLPHQTVETVLATMEQVLTLAPDRVALFGYAHVPWMKKHQRLIDETALPDAAARLMQSTAAAERLARAGYVAIGIDHFARPDDSLGIAAASGGLKRNFQGYTTDASEVLIGLGASAIGRLPEGYVQNNSATGEYCRAVTETGLAVARGVALSEEDRVRGWVIERLMCDFAVSLDELRHRFGTQAAPIIAEMAVAALGDADGLVSLEPSRFAITEDGRPFARSVASAFDTYLGNGAGRHSIAV